MAISNWGQLKTEAIAWLGDRPDLTSRMGNFWLLAEGWLNRECPLRLTNRTETVLTGTIGSRLITLPTDYGKPIALKLNTFGLDDELKFVAASSYQRILTNAVPRKWSIKGASIELDANCDQAHTFRFVYVRKDTLDTALDGNTSTYLTSYPDICLFALLTEAFSFGLDVEGASFWGGRRDKAKQEIVRYEGASLDGELSHEPELVNDVAYNINEG